uniref:dUTPase domain-containing protein n=1 Tax=Heterorhabditis bacteriophora TaxID=37862 RepID=A0A1I7WPV7_HETBA
MLSLTYSFISILHCTTTTSINNQKNPFRHTANQTFDDTFVYFAPHFANGKLKVPDGLKLTVRRARRPIRDGHVIVLQPGIGASTDVDCSMILSESETKTWKSLEIRD